MVQGWHCEDATAQFATGHILLPSHAAKSALAKRRHNNMVAVSAVDTAMMALARVLLMVEGHLCSLLRTTKYACPLLPS